MRWQTHAVQNDSATGITLVDGGSATAHLHAALLQAVSLYPDELDAAGVPQDVAAFRSSYPDVLPCFEAARASADQRVDIARAVVSAAGASFVVNPGDVPLADAVLQPTDARPLESRRWGGTSRLHPGVPLDGTELSGSALVEAVSALVDRGSASPSVAEAISWLEEAAEPDGVDLSSRRIAMLGAGAELAPTRLWLEGGADVLWVDVQDPPADLLERDDLSGSLHWIPGGVDLLTDPHGIRATIEEFANGESIDLGLYAYAGGRAREWRLTAAMNAIVDALPGGSVRGVAMLLSPTTCGVLTDAELAAEATRRADAPIWLRALDRMHALGRGGGHTTVGSTSANRGIVSVQGGSYQAAQYVGKMLAAEVWATGDPAITVSANTAGVSLTESLGHPVFETAFAGANALGIETYSPATTAALNGLLTLHDRLDPAADGRSLDQLFTTRVHGGIYVAPYPIDPALRVAAGIGLIKDPRRLIPMVRR
jgi:hypothetical protein